ncbi:maleate cis-trans isomerase family protein [Kribbella sp. WER1]
MEDAIVVGVITPHAVPGPEVELPEMAPVRVELVRTEPTPPALAAAASVLRSADVLAFASTGSGYALGYDGETALVERLRERAGVPACSTSRSAVAALRALGVHRVSLVHPPWFGRDLNARGAEYFRRQGFEVVEARLAELPQDPRLVRPEMVVEWVVEHVSDRAEAMFLGGNGFRAAQAIEPLEVRTGRVVLEANQVLLWSVVESVGAQVRGFGKLFDD